MSDPLTLHFDAAAVRQHFVPEDDEYDLIADLDDETLASIGEAALNDETLLDAYGNALAQAVYDWLMYQSTLTHRRNPRR